MKKGMPWEIAMSHMLTGIPMRRIGWLQGYYAIMDNVDCIRIYKSNSLDSSTYTAVERHYRRSRTPKSLDKLNDDWVFNFATFNLGDL